MLLGAKRARLVVFIGTSFSVGITDRISELGLKNGAQVISIDPAGVSPHPHIHVVAERAEVLLPRVVEALAE